MTHLQVYSKFTSSITHLQVYSKLSDQLDVGLVPPDFNISRAALIKSEKWEKSLHSTYTCVAGDQLQNSIFFLFKKIIFRDKPGSYRIL